VGVEWEGTVRRLRKEGQNEGGNTVGKINSVVSCILCFMDKRIFGARGACDAHAFFPLPIHLKGISVERMPRLSKVMPFTVSLPFHTYGSLPASYTHQSLLPIHSKTLLFVSFVHSSGFCFRHHLALIRISRSQAQVFIARALFLALTVNSYNTSLNANKNAAVSTLWLTLGPIPP